MLREGVRGVVVGLKGGVDRVDRGGGGGEVVEES